MFKLASLFVEIKAEDTELKKQVGAVQGQLSAMGVAIGSAVGSLAATAIASASSAITGFVARGIKGASDLGESLSKVQAVFGDSAGVITAQADELAKAFGLPKQAILDAGAGIGLVAKAAGQSQAQAAGLGASMAKLAADASSFYNVPLETALEKIRSGLVGESEPLRAFGVLLTEESVAAEAVAMGLAKSAKEVDQQAKVMARASLITKGLADAQGDLERTADSTSNQWRKLAGSLGNMAVEMGTALLPAIHSLLNGLTEFIDYARPAIDGVKATFTAFSSSVVATVETVRVLWRNLADEWEIVTIKAREMGSNVVAVIAVIPDNLSRIGDYIAGNWRQLITDAVNAVGTVFHNLGDNIGRLAYAVYEFLSDPTQGFNFEWKPLLDGFQATAAALPEMMRPALVSLQSEIDAVGERIARREAKRAQEIFDKAKAAGQPAKAAAAAAGKKVKDFKSETSGSAEFAMKLRARILDGGDDTAKKQLEAQQKIAENSKQTVEAIKKKKWGLA